MKAMICMMVAVCLLGSAGCANTWRGAGRDTERIGEKMQKHD